MKKTNHLLNIIIGIFIGNAFYVIWDYKTAPGKYQFMSAPWYSSILLYGVVTLAVVLVCMVIKAITKNSIKKKNNSKNNS